MPLGLVRGDRAARLARAVRAATRASPTCSSASVEFGALLAPLAQHARRRSARAGRWRSTARATSAAACATRPRATALLSSLPERRARRAGRRRRLLRLRRHVRGQVPRRLRRRWAATRSATSHEAGAGELVSGDLGCLLHLGGWRAENQVALATTTLRRAARARGLRRRERSSTAATRSSTSGSTKALGDTTPARHAAGARARHLPGFRAAVEARHPDWPERVDARARRSARDAVARAAPSCSTASRQRFTRAAAAASSARPRRTTPSRAVLEIARRRGVHAGRQGQVDGHRGARAQRGARGGGPDARRDRPRRVDRPARRRAPLAPARARSSTARAARSPRCSRPRPRRPDVGRPRSSWSPTRASACARRSSRPGIGITGANFMVAESGTVIVLENEGNGRLVSSLPRCHVVLAGHRAACSRRPPTPPSWSSRLALAAVGRELPSYVSWLSGPARATATTGPRSSS